jgi:phosphatidylinositol glycan class B
MKSVLNSSYRNIFILGLVVFLITSIFSVGHHHPDEHFQILEFCNYKLGNSPASDLPWEFHERIRPTLLPSLGVLLIKSMNIVGIHNPFTYTLIFRILTSLFSWLVISNLCLLLISDFSSNIGKKIFLFLTFFLWFMPFASVRFSSENYSAIAFLSAIYFILRFTNDKLYKKSFQLVFAGLLLGFSFFFRFQIGFAIIGLALWLILINKMPWKNVFILMISGVFAMLFCVYLDFWFYGEFELTPVNYFISNIIENKAANWGTFPWWYYFQLFTFGTIPPISIFLLIFFFLGIYKRPTNIFTWCIIPFLIGHFIVGHKELRFLLPLVFCFIYLTAIGVNYFINSQKLKKSGRIIFISLVAINLLLLSFKMFIPAQEAIKSYKFLYDYSSKREIVLLCKEESIYELVGLEVNFYKSNAVKCIVLNDDKEVSDYLKENNSDSVFLLEQMLSSDTKYLGYTNETIYCPFPQWIIHLNFSNWISRARIWEIQELKKIK